MKQALLAISLVAFNTTLAAAEDVYYCSVAQAAGIKWDEKSPPEGRVAEFREERFTMKMISSKKRILTGKTGVTMGNHYLECDNPWTNEPNLSFCTSSSGSYSWMFKGDAFTMSLLFGQPLGGDPNIYVSHGTCTKF